MRRTQLQAAGTELKIAPLSGNLAPQCAVPIRIQMTPSEQKNISVSIPCRIKQKFRNLRLDIKGEGYYLMPSLKLVEEGMLDELSSVSLVLLNHIPTKNSFYPAS